MLIQTKHKRPNPFERFNCFIHGGHNWDRKWIDERYNGKKGRGFYYNHCLACGVAQSTACFGTGFDFEDDDLYEVVGRGYPEFWDPQIKNPTATPYNHTPARPWHDHSVFAIGQRVENEDGLIGYIVGYESEIVYKVDWRTGLMAGFEDDPDNTDICYANQLH